MTAGPCSAWVTAADLAARPDMTDAVVDSGVLGQAAVDASGLLYALSGRQFPGVCSATVRPYSASTYSCAGRSDLLALLARGGSVDSWTVGANGGCVESGIRLGVYPVRSVSQVKVDGAVLSPSAYRVDDQTWLVRPGGVWPTWQRLDLPDTQPGTFSVALTHGADPPAMGVSAAAALGAELAKMRSGLAHRLPQRLQTVTRQGVTVAVLDPQTFLSEGLTGLYDVDLFLRAVNPHRQARPPTVWSPDLVQTRRS